MSIPQHHRSWGVHVGPEDRYSNTVEAAARYARDHTLAWDMDEPDATDIGEAEADARQWEQERCDQMRTRRAGL